MPALAGARTWRPMSQRGGWLGALVLLGAGCGGLVVFEADERGEQNPSRLAEACQKNCEKRQRHPPCYPSVEVCAAECALTFETTGEPCNEPWLVYLECTATSEEQFISCSESGLCFEEWTDYSDCRFESAP